MNNVRPTITVFAGVRGRVLAVLCQADDRLSGGQIAVAARSSRSRAHGVLRELVDTDIVSATQYPSVTMFELRDNAVARAIETLHDRKASRGEHRAAVGIIRHVLPQWSRERRELSRLTA